MEHVFRVAGVDKVVDKGDVRGDCGTDGIGFFGIVFEWGKHGYEGCGLAAKG